MIKRVLIPTDFTPGSERAVAFAVEHFPGAVIKLLHVSQTERSASLSDKRLPEQLLLHQEREAWARNELVDLAQLFRVQVEHAHGKVAPAIARQARTWRAQIIVMGGHAKNGLPHPEGGKVAQAVISTSNIPVLMVPNPHDPPKEVNP